MMAELDQEEGSRHPAARPGIPEALHHVLRIGSVSVWPPVLLAPMAGETGSVLRQLCKRMGAGLVCTELTSSHGLYYRNRRSAEYLRWTEDERPVSAQLFGAEPEIMAEAARICCAAGADLLDINMGCWVPKVARTGAGASLLKDMPRAAQVMSAVVKASSVPVTIKTRVGWDGCVGSAVELARVAESVGVAAVTIHGRTAVQGFSGNADWRPIAEAKSAVGIPVIGNGDVRTATDAERMFRETGCDGVMIGRAALGYPWIFREIRAHFGLEGGGGPPSAVERLGAAAEHARLLALQAHGCADPDTPLPSIARGQLCHYLAELPHAAEARRRLTRLNTLGDVEEILSGVAAIVRSGRGLQPLC